MNPLLNRVLYYAAQRYRGENVDGTLRELEASQSWPPERLRELQWQRVRALVDRAYRASPWWQQHWKSLGFAPGDLKHEADWRALPPLAKAAVQESADAMHTSDAPSGLKAATSGSSGTPVAVLRSHLSWAHAHANVFRGWRWHGVDVGDPYAYFWGVPLAADDRATAERKDRFFNRVRVSAFTLDAALARAAHTRLSRQRTRFAFGYPSALTKFAQELADAGLDGRALGWRCVITSAECLRDEQRERIADVFGCAVVDSYGCAEAGVAGFEDAGGHMRVPVESVRVDYHRNEDGAWELLLTDLHNFSQPLIRYRVGDLVDPVGDPAALDYWPRPDGSSGLPVLGRVAGRAGDTLELPDGRRMNANLPSYVFKRHGKAGTVREYQFVQFPAGRIELRVVTGPAWTEAVRGELVSEVQQVLGLQVDVQTVARFERRGRGKHRDFIKAADLDTSPTEGAGE